MRIVQVVFALALVLIAWSYWGDRSANITNWFTDTTESNQLARAGQWGDSFGALNALASAAAFVVILATLLVQSKAIEEQARDLHRQRFESTFFELIRLMRELRGEITFNYSREYLLNIKKNGASAARIFALKKVRTGSNALRAANLEIVYWLVNQGIAKSPTKSQMINIYMRRVHSKSEATLSPYYRVIYSILDSIRRDKILSDREKVRYGNLLRSQLRSYEVVLLAINGLCPISKDMGKLLTSYRMLKYLPDSAMRRRLERLYLKEAFEPRKD